MIKIFKSYITLTDSPFKYECMAVRVWCRLTPGGDVEITAVQDLNGRPVYPDKQVTDRFEEEGWDLFKRSSKGVLAY